MPDHLHVLFTPAGIALERAVQFIKGGFSFRAKRELGFAWEIWQPKYHDRGVRDLEEYGAFKGYIHENPVKRGLVIRAEDYPWSSASGRFELDDLPQRLKPPVSTTVTPG
jgi:putative transposase